MKELALIPIIIIILLVIFRHQVGNLFENIFVSIQYKYRTFRIKNNYFGESYNSIYGP